MRVLLADVSFIGPEHGGRSIRSQSGYHPQIEAGDEYTSCAIDSMSGETTFEFETSYRVSLRLLFPELHENRFSYY